MKTRPKMKSLPDIQLDMSVLYDEVSSGERELKIASELANIAGKNLKAYQLQLAREIFLSGIGKSRQLPPPGADIINMA